MDHILNNIFGHGFLVFLSGLIAAALFFVMVGIRELSDDRKDGFLFVVLGLFFLVAHFFLLMNLPEYSETSAGSIKNLLMVWNWLVTIFAPALISLFILIGIYNFVITQVKIGLTKLFFGLSLGAFLYWLGAGWAIDIRGILTVVWTLVWFDVEFETAK
jgi:hypothetical protein